MASKKDTGTASTTSTRKTRTRTPKTYIAVVVGGPAPVVIVANSQKDALKAVLTLKIASHADLMTAGKNGYRVIDTSVPHEQMRVDEAAA